MSPSIETTTLGNKELRTHRPSISSEGQPPSSYEVFSWPEFQALMKRLGVDTSVPVRSIRLDLPWDDLVKITVEIMGMDKKS